MSAIVVDVGSGVSVSMTLDSQTGVEGKDASGTSVDRGPCRAEVGAADFPKGGLKSRVEIDTEEFSRM